MQMEPDLQSFSENYDAGKAQLASTRLVADLETPVSAYMKLAKDQAMSFLLESVEGGAVRGRYSMIGFAPDIVWRASGNVAEINRNPARKPDGFKPCAEPTLESLRALLDESQIDMPDVLPPMAAGVFGYVGYDTVRLVEHLPNENPDVLGIPDSLLVRPTLMVIFDSVKDEMTVVTPVRPEPKLTAEKAYGRARRRLLSVVRALESPLEHPGPSLPNDKIVSGDPVSNTTPAEFTEMVNRATEYIKAGDVFQVVLSQRFSAPFQLPPFALYRALRRTNPSPFLFYLDFNGFSLVGSSPEILVRVRDGEVTIRPLAGTARRGDTISEDNHLAEMLLADPKERAEHLMLLDLGRNDVGRVAE
ncbi:MAG: anthranilate synthase component I family protein, partial [Hyphomicrobiaceae bacterium]